MKIKGPVNAANKLRQVSVRTCGDFGGRNAKGTPCAQPGVGLCPQHNETSLVAMQSVKKEVLERLAKGEYIIQIAKAVNMSPVQLWRWRKQDEDFDNAVAALSIDNDDARVKLVEESLFHRIIMGTAMAAETIFYLKNRAPHRWRDKISTELLDEDGKPQRISVTVIQQVMTRVEHGRESIRSIE